MASNIFIVLCVIIVAVGSLVFFWNPARQKVLSFFSTLCFPVGIWLDQELEKYFD